MMGGQVTSPGKAAPGLPGPAAHSLAQPGSETFQAGDCRKLMDAAERILKGCGAVIELAHSERDVARDAGIETIAIEMAVILEGERLARFMDALAEACETGAATQFSHDGLARMHRLESLLMEATRAMGKLKGKNIPAMAGTSVKLGQAGKPSDALLIGSLAALGVLATVLIVVAVSGEK